MFKKAFLNPRKNGVGWGYILIFVWVIMKVCLCINSAKINKTYISIMCFFSLERKRSPFNWTTNPLHKHLQITICSNEIKLKPFIELSKPFIHCGRYIHTKFNSAQANYWIINSFRWKAAKIHTQSGTYFLLHHENSLLTYH